MSGDSTYRRWAHGRCVCCGWNEAGAEGLDGTLPKAIGEGVQLCGYCVEREHDDPPELVQAMLEAIVTRDDAPVEDAINHASANLVVDNRDLYRIGALR